MTRIATVATYRQGMSERELQDAVVECARWNGWRVYQASDVAVAVAAAGQRWDAMPDTFVDAVFIRERVVWVEFKDAKGRLRPDQERLRDDLLAAGEEWHLIRPDDWIEGGTGLVEEVFGCPR